MHNGGEFWVSAVVDSDWPTLRLTFLLIDTADLEAVEAEPRDTCTNNPPSNPLFDKDFDDHQDKTELQLVRSYSRCEDPANTSPRDTDCQFDAELASVDSDSSTPHPIVLPSSPLLHIFSWISYYRIRWRRGRPQHDGHIASSWWCFALKLSTLALTSAFYRSSDRSQESFGGRSKP